MDLLPVMLFSKKVQRNSYESEYENWKVRLNMKRFTIIDKKRDKKIKKMQVSEIFKINENSLYYYSMFLRNYHMCTSWPEWDFEVRTWECCSLGLVPRSDSEQSNNKICCGPSL